MKKYDLELISKKYLIEEIKRLRNEIKELKKESDKMGFQLGEIEAAYYSDMWDEDIVAEIGNILKEY